MKRKRVLGLLTFYGPPAASFLAAGASHFLDAALVDHFFAGGAGALFEGIAGHIREKYRDTKADEKLAGLMATVAAARNVLSAGVRGVDRRGFRDASEWRSILESAGGTLVFFGKDHSELLRHQRETLMKLVESGHRIHFYVLAESSLYYRATEKADELDKRKKAGEQLRSMRDVFRLGQNNVQADAIAIKEYSDEPRFSYTHLGTAIYIGIYLPGLDNEDVPEIQVHKGGDAEEWLWHACEKAFARATRDAVPI